MTSSATYLHKRLIEDNAFKSEGAKYILNILIDTNSITAATIDRSSKIFTAFESFHFSDAMNAGSRAIESEQILEESLLMNATRCSSVSCCVCFPKSALIPESLYDENKAQLLIDFNFCKNKSEEILLTNKISEPDAWNIFTAPADIIQMLKIRFSNIEFYHHTTVLIKRALSISRNQKEKSVFIHVRKYYFELIITEGSRLIFCNTFHHGTMEDYLYFVLYTLEQMGLNFETIQVTLSSEPGISSSYFKNISDYVRHVCPFESISPFTFSSRLQELQGTSILFSQHLCGS